MILKADKDHIELSETVTVTLDEYNDMHIKAEHFDTIARIAFHGVKLNWTKDEIDLNVNDVEAYIKALFLERCDLELKHLRAQEGLENE